MFGTAIEGIFLVIIVVVDKIFLQVWRRLQRQQRQVTANDDDVVGVKQLT